MLAWAVVSSKQLAEGRLIPYQGSSVKRSARQHTPFCSKRVYVNCLQTTNTRTHPTSFAFNKNVNFVCFYNNIIQYFLTIGATSDMHPNITWLYSCNLGNCYILPLFLWSALRMIAKETGTWRCILIHVKAYFVTVPREIVAHVQMRSRQLPSHCRSEISSTQCTVCIQETHFLNTLYRALFVGILIF